MRFRLLTLFLIVGACAFALRLFMGMFMGSDLPDSWEKEEIARATKWGNGNAVLVDSDVLVWQIKEDGRIRTESCVVWTQFRRSDGSTRYAVSHVFRSQFSGQWSLVVEEIDRIFGRAVFDHPPTSGEVFDSLDRIGWNWELREPDKIGFPPGAQSPGTIPGLRYVDGHVLEAVWRKRTGTRLEGEIPAVYRR